MADGYQMVTLDTTRWLFCGVLKSAIYYLNVCLARRECHGPVSMSRRGFYTTSYFRQSVGFSRKTKAERQLRASGTVKLLLEVMEMFSHMCLHLIWFCLPSSRAMLRATVAPLMPVNLAEAQNPPPP